jgi:hypothetical protein
MAASADDDVVVHRYPERSGDSDDRLGHLYIGLGWRRIAGGMIMYQDYCAVLLRNECSISDGHQKLSNSTTQLRDLPAQAQNP